MNTKNNIFHHLNAVTVSVVVLDFKDFIYKFLFNFIYFLTFNWEFFPVDWEKKDTIFKWEYDPISAWLYMSGKIFDPCICHNEPLPC